MMWKTLAGSLGLLALATPVAARDALGVFGEWAAFHDARPARCYAIAEPRRAADRGWRAFAAVSSWPDRRVNGQVHIRLSRARAIDAQVMLVIGDKRIPLVSGRADAWAPDPRTDALIVAAMRSGEGMAAQSLDNDHKRFTDSYRLKGAATAIDAAAIGCARRG